MQQDALPESESAIFSIYCTQDAIELLVGCQDSETARFVSAHKIYKNAHAFSQVLVEKLGLPFKDYVGDR